MAMQLMNMAVCVKKVSGLHLDLELAHAVFDDVVRVMLYSSTSFLPESTAGEGTFIARISKLENC